MTANINHSELDILVNTKQSGWKYYNQIKKKAMEQEFSLAGLLISLSIAFFVVMITAYSLHLLYASYQKTRLNDKINKQIYLLEMISASSMRNYLEFDFLPETQKKNIDSLNIITIG